MNELSPVQQIKNFTIRLQHSMLLLRFTSWCSHVNTGAAKQGAFSAETVSWIILQEFRTFHLALSTNGRSTMLVVFEMVRPAVQSTLFLLGSPSRILAFFVLHLFPIPWWQVPKGNNNISPVLWESDDSIDHFDWHFDWHFGLKLKPKGTAFAWYNVVVWMSWREQTKKGIKTFNHRRPFLMQLWHWEAPNF